MKQARIQWMAPAPLWRRILDNPAEEPRLKKPLILRFTGSDLMDVLFALLEKEPGRIHEYALHRETKNEPGAGWKPLGDPLLEEIKLYHPTHGRYYLVTAGLVAAAPAFPDLVEGEGETLSFVIRLVRSETSAAAREFGWVKSEKNWRPLSEPNTVLIGEEKLPLFAVPFAMGGEQRRLLLGYLPVSIRDSEAVIPIAETTVAGAPEMKPDFRIDALWEAALTPMIQLRGVLLEEPGKLNDDQSRDALMRIIIGLAGWIIAYLPPIWEAMTGSKEPTDPVLKSFHGIFKQLFHGEVDWQKMIDRVYTRRRAWEGGRWNDPLINILSPNGIVGIVENFPVWSDPRQPGKLSPEFQHQLQEILETVEPIPAETLTNTAVFQLRCVFDRPERAEVLVSEPSIPFTIAAYEDSQAPKPN